MADAPQSLKCPECGAALHDDGRSRSIVCTYCSTDVQIPRERPAPPPAVVITPGRHPLQDERDELAARIKQQEGEWNLRIAATKLSSLGQILPSLFIGFLIGAIVFLFGVMLGSAAGFDPNKGLGAALGTSFYLCVIVVPYIAYRVRTRDRARQAIAIAAQRDTALEPLRKRLKRLDDRIAGLADDDPRLRLRELEADRKEISASMDKVYAIVEDVRTADPSDVTKAPMQGCIVAIGIFVLASIALTETFTKPERFSTPAMILPTLGVWFLATVVIWTGRVIHRKRRLARVIEARDAAVPEIQRQLAKVQAEIDRLA